MNQEERSVIDGIFERLKGVANQPRDPEAERHIAELIKTQPYATYALAQANFVQEQALLSQQRQIEQMQAQIQQLQAAPPQAQSAPQTSGGFLSGLFGGGAAAPPQRDTPAYGQREAAPNSPWGAPRQGTAPQGGPAEQAAPQRQGMGFLGTAVTAAAGVAGGMMLGNILSSAFGGGNAHAAQNFGGQGSGGFGNLGLDQNRDSQGQPVSMQNDADDDGNYDDSDYDSDDFDTGGDDSYDV